MSREYVLSSAAASKRMKANHSKNTKLEILFRKELRKNGFSGYRLHNKKVFGTPDISWHSLKIAIFINGCFWHRCSKCLKTPPKANAIFWESKLNENLLKDTLKELFLIDSGWKVITAWECDSKNNFENAITELRKHFSIRKPSRLKN